MTISTLYIYDLTQIVSWTAFAFIIGACIGMTIPSLVEIIRERRKSRTDELEEIRKEHEALMLALKNIMERTDV